MNGAYKSFLIDYRINNHNRFLIFLIPATAILFYSRLFSCESYKKVCRTVRTYDHLNKCSIFYLFSNRMACVGM